MAGDCRQRLLTRVDKPGVKLASNSANADEWFGHRRFRWNLHCDIRRISGPQAEDGRKHSHGELSEKSKAVGYRYEKLSLEICEPLRPLESGLLQKEKRAFCQTGFHFRNIFVRADLASVYMTPRVRQELNVAYAVREDAERIAAINNRSTLNGLQVRPELFQHCGREVLGRTPCLLLQEFESLARDRLLPVGIAPDMDRRFDFGPV